MKAVIGCLAFLWCMVSPAGDWTGFLKNYSWLADPPAGFGTPDRMGSSTTRLRLQVRTAWGHGWSFQGAAETGVTFQHHQLFSTSLFQDTATDPYRFSDPDGTPFPSRPDADSNVGGLFNLDRLAVSWGGDHVDVIIGRQAVAWGSARVVNPTDILAPFTAAALDTEYRPGVDAVRVRAAFATGAELDAGYVFGPGGDMRRSALFLRGRTAIGSTDLTGTVMRFHTHGMVGIDLTRSFGGTGSWLEAAVVDAGAFGPVDGPDYVRWSAGIDRQLTPTLYGFIEGHFNGAGTSDRARYAGQGSLPAYRDGAVYLLGRWYLAGGITVQWTPLVTGTGMVLANLSDGSVFASFRVTRSLSDNVSVELGCYHGTGTPPPAVPTGGIAVAAFDEFAAWPDMVFVAVRAYF